MTMSPDRSGAESPCRRAGSNLLGQRPCLGGVATHHLDGMSGLGGEAADRCGHAA